MKHIGWIAAMVLAMAGAASGLSAQEGPEEPDEAFTVYVFTEMEDAEKAKYSVEKVKEEVERGLKKHKDWFLVAKGPEKAELTVEVMRHDVNQQMRHKLVARVNATGTGKDWVTETWEQERHFLEVRVDAFGRQKLVQGEDAREQGGTLRRAAEQIADDLEAYCRESYAELSRLRRQVP